MRTTTLILILIIMISLFHAAQPDQTSAQTSEEENQQKSGMMHDKGAGFSLQLPEGWVYQAGPQGILVGHNTIPGMVLISPVSANTLDELVNEVQIGLQSGGDELMLYPVSIDARDDQTLVVSVQGQAGFQSVRGYSVSRLSPYGGGLSISALVASEHYDKTYSDLVEQVVGSMEFSEPEQTQKVQYWYNRLSGRKLTYMSSHYSSGGGFGGYSTGGGWSERSEFHLCADGKVHGSSSSSVNVDTGGAFGHSGRDSGRMQGTWQIQSFAGFPIIHARFMDGTIYRFTLSEQNGNTYLDNTQWHVTNDAQCL